MWLFTDETAKHIKKKWERLTSSIWTKLFAILFLIQFGIVVFFHSRMLVRNKFLYHNAEFQESYKCDKESRGQNTDTGNYLFTFSTIQSVIFMMFQLYFVYFGLNAIFHEHIIQIITLVGLNFLSAGCSIAQLYELKIRIDRVRNNEECPAFGFNVDILRIDFPPIVLLSVFSVFSALIACKLYQQFGWNIYKRIGGDFKIHRIYRNNLIFLVLLKLNIFFWIIYIIPTVLFSINVLTANAIDMILILYHSCTTILALILQILAYRSVNSESRTGMITFTMLWLFIVADYGLLIYASVRLLIFGSYFLILFTSVYLVIALVTLVYSIIVTANFGRGLREAIERYKTRMRRQNTFNVPTLNVSPPKPSSSSAYSHSSASASQQFPPSPSNLNDNISNHSDEKNEKRKNSVTYDDDDDSRWTIDD